MFLAVTSKGVVHSTTARLPSCSKVMPSCRLHVEQEPQSPRPVIRKSTSCATLTRVLPGAGALAFFFEASVRTVQPWRWTNSCGDLVQHLLGIELAVLQDADPQAVELARAGARNALRFGVVERGE